ncbi:nucleotide exchange factor GrpE [Coxiella-like endosymbiont]|uniref:nucleotide exchange factor GrpE n=1 Tax=Coxiella-like endosymbiont TaxID=1592897 RepID=UPI00359C20A8
MRMSKNDKTISEHKNKCEKKIETEEKEVKVEEDTQPEIESPLEEPELPSREKLEEQLIDLEHKVEEYKNQFLRAKAEIDNLRKRTEREKSDAIKYGTSQLLTDLLPVVDSLIHGLKSLGSQDPCAKNMREGMSLTLDLLHKILVKHGVEVIDPQSGDFFNPEFHEAMSIQKILTAKANTIAQVIQKGYRLNGRVLRAARVIVVG